MMDQYSPHRSSHTADRPSKKFYKLIFCVVVTQEGRTSLLKTASPGSPIITGREMSVG